jgi:hypothetical protein
MATIRIAAAATLIFALAAPAAALDRTRHVTTDRDTSIVVGNYYSIRRDCSTKPALVEIVQMPSKGQLLLREDEHTLKRGPGVGGDCLGQKGRASIVTYTPSKGFVGRDMFRLNVAYTKRTDSFTGTVAVRQPRKTKAKAKARSRRRAAR